MAYNLDSFNLGYRKGPLNEIGGAHKFEGKRILEIGSDAGLSSARALSAMGAREIICVNPELPAAVYGNITVISGPLEKQQFEAGSFDIIFGIGVLEHIENIPALIECCGNLWSGDREGCVYIQGNPMYACSVGHHVYIEIGDRLYAFHEDALNPLEPWEHLTFDTPNDAYEALARRGNKDAEKLAAHIFEAPVSRHSSTAIASQFREAFDGVEFLAFPSRHKAIGPHFSKAREKYPLLDLVTANLTVWIKGQNRSTSAPTPPETSREKVKSTQPRHELVRLIHTFTPFDAPIRVAHIGLVEMRSVFAAVEALRSCDELYLFGEANCVNEIQGSLLALNPQVGCGIFGYRHTARQYDSYAWTLAKLLLEGQAAPESLDIVFLDGRKTFLYDAAACAAIKLLLKPGGYLVFNNIEWTYGNSPSVNQQIYPLTSSRMTPEQIETPQVVFLMKALMDKDPDFTRVAMSKGNKLRAVYRKVKESCIQHNETQ